MEIRDLISNTHTVLIFYQWSLRINMNPEVTRTQPPQQNVSRSIFSLVYVHEDVPVREIPSDETFDLSDLVPSLSVSLANRTKTTIFSQRHKKMKHNKRMMIKDLILSQHQRGRWSYSSGDWSDSSSEAL